jgi:hypothetical protein
MCRYTEHIDSLIWQNILALYFRRTLYRLLYVLFAPILLFALHIQQTVMRNETRRRLQQANVDKT